ncbi:hypothetical protein [Aeromonas dhakensis]|uniref:hypothetical protein n=1 Tax=Aeromonas dhakensis TaxID=196024 RepID=UPI0038D0EBCB
MKSENTYLVVPSPDQSGKPQVQEILNRGIATGFKGKNSRVKKCEAVCIVDEINRKCYVARIKKVELHVRDVAFECCDVHFGLYSEFPWNDMINEFKAVDSRRNARYGYLSGLWRYLKV